jgi:AAA ATPase domain
MHGFRMTATLAERLAWRDEQHFVGREPELEFFESLLVDEPSHQVVLVHGPGGIGKSTLLREVARRAEKRGYQSTLVEGRELAPVPGEIEHALGDIASVELPLIMFDTYERMSAASGYLRHRLLPSLPARSLVILAGRKPPDSEWFQGGWERLATELELRPFDAEDARKLCAAHGMTDAERCDEVIAWAEGSPLALSLAAATGAQFGIDDPNVVRAMIRRLAHTELDGGNLDVAAVAALARCVNARMLRDVLPGVDPEEAEAWLRSRSFAESLHDGITLHDLVRRAVRSDLRRRDPEHERELRRRIADHLYERASRGEPRLMVDLAELRENPALRWGFGVMDSTRYRVDEVREGDTVAAAPQVAARAEGGLWWTVTEPFFLQAPERVCVVRDMDENLCGFNISVSPSNAPPIAEQDPLLGPWLAHARREHAGEEVILWRDSIDFTSSDEGDISSPVLALMNTAAVLRSGLTNPRYSYLPIHRENKVAMEYSRAVGAEHIAELDLAVDDHVTECHVVDYGPGGMLARARATVYAELGISPPDVVAHDEPDSGSEVTITADMVRDALRSLDNPLELAASPLASGDTPEERGASVRALLTEATANAFGQAADERLLQQIIERGYLDSSASHESAALELNVSRATYFRRLRVASERVADYVLASRAAS